MRNPSFLGNILLDILEGIWHKTGQQHDTPSVSDALNVPPATAVGLFDGTTRVTAEMALRLSGAFPSIAPEKWMQVQHSDDLAHLAQARKRRPMGTRVLYDAPLRVAGLN